MTNKELTSELGPPCSLILADGSVHTGWSFGAQVPMEGEVGNYQMSGFNRHNTLTSEFLPLGSHCKYRPFSVSDGHGGLPRVPDRPLLPRSTAGAHLSTSRQLRSA